MHIVYSLMFRMMSSEFTTGESTQCAYVAQKTKMAPPVELRGVLVPMTVLSLQFRMEP